MEMIYFECVTKENIKEHNANQPQIHDQPRRVLIIRDSGYDIFFHYFI